jgi:SNF2 family DNA or RNA helicase
MGTPSARAVDGLCVTDLVRDTMTKAILEPYQLHPYQKRAVEHQCSNPETMMWLDMGLGKTPITLTSIAHLQAVGYLRGVIVVAPKRVCHLVWRQEAAKWSHTKHLTFSVVMGSREMRTRALLRPADVYLINYENLGWLAETLGTYFLTKGKPLPFNGLVWDEISKMKNSTTNRVKSFMRIAKHFTWTTGLTGTPASNGYKDLHGQYLVVDKGQRLGVFKTKFKTQFFFTPTGSGTYAKDIPFQNAEDEIKALIGDITLEMSAEDYNPLPKLIINDIELVMDGPLREKYNQMEAELFLHIDQSGTEVEIFNQVALMAKCLQYGNGAIYPVSGQPQWEPIHDLKLDALEEIIDEAQGQPVLCSYAYRSDAERIMERFKHLDPINLTECKSESSLKSAMARWKSGDCPLMIGHPASMGHGIDGLQDAGYTLVWYGLTYSLDLYDQFNARLRRQGQPKPVVCHRLMVLDTLDQAQAIALNGKAGTEAGLRRAIKEYRLSKGV